jgi:hypothetical protein
MANLQVFPPDAANEALFGEVRGTRRTPVPVIAFDGPEGHLGPEAAGAVLVLHMTMVDEGRTQAFWRQVALVCKAASEDPGFIRMIAFFDGLANWALGFWKSVEAAQSFARAGPHRAAMAEMYEKNFEYTHFACLFVPVAPRPRHAYCDQCGTEVVMPAERCPRCSNELADVFVAQAKGKDPAVPS